MNLAAIFDAVPGLQEMLGGDNELLARTNERRITDLVARPVPEDELAGHVQALNEHWPQSPSVLTCTRTYRSRAPQKCDAG